MNNKTQKQKQINKNYSLQQINNDIRIQGINDYSQTGINSFLIQCLNKNNFFTPTPIQYHSIKNFFLFSQHNIIAQSKSGTGKTLAFLIPILNQISINQQKIQKNTICLIILPTRQLSLQVHQYLKQILTKANQIKPKNQIEKQTKNKLLSLTSLLAIGGIPIDDDKKLLLISGAHIIVGTIGKIYQLMQIGSLKTQYLKYVVFDQGDKLWENKDQKLQKIMKKIKNTAKILHQFNKKLRLLIYSATYTEASLKKLLYKLKQGLNFTLKFIFIQTLKSQKNQIIQNITQNLSELKFVNFQNQSSRQTINQNLINLENIKKFWIDINQGQQNISGSIINKKCKKLKQILNQTNYKRCLIFVQKKALLQQIYEQIIQFNPLFIHGSLSQAARIKVMNQANNSKIILASDLLARGIDLLLDLVILYDANMNQTFWHRIGRTGRFGRTGVAISLDKIQKWNTYVPIEINKILSQTEISQNINKKKQWYGTYMTQYGQWQELDSQKQQIINKNYYFFNQNQEKEEQEKQTFQKSKKYKKIQKKVLKNLESKKQMNQIKKIQTIYSSQKQFIDAYFWLFNCKECSQMLNSIQNLTYYKFQIAKYFNSFKDKSH